jgi:hypothetical protein
MYGDPDHGVGMGRACGKAGPTVADKAQWTLDFTAPRISEVDGGPAKYLGSQLHLQKNTANIALALARSK